jgi:diguanylate cyclase (GGDEF)-like protein
VGGVGMTQLTALPPVAIVADDDELGRLLLTEAVASLGLGSLSFDNGAEALAAALDSPLAIALLDIDMPGLDGLEVCRRLRSDRRYDNVPIVIVTGHDDPQAVRHAFEAGATDFISKPVNWALLPRRLEYILRNAQAARDLRLAAERIEKLAYFDPLTGLANRHCCLDRTTSWMQQATERGESVSIIYMDLNSFKRVNDTFGHSVGDAVLRTVAQRLLGTVAALDTDGGQVLVSRLGGDEFVLVVLHRDARALGLRVANACRHVLAAPIEFESLEFHCSPSVGMAVFPDDGPDAATVLKHADIAMYQSKADGADEVVVYRAVLSSRLRDWLALEARLRRAVRDEMLTIEFQPKFCLQSGRLIGAEALLRWRDEEHGDVSPTRFIEIAEDSGLILELTTWVVRAVCRQIRHWQDHGVDIPVAINCSPKELMHGDPAALIAEESAKAGIHPSLIEVEITESLLVNDSVGVRNVLAALRRLGCSIALDDFGTRYSSLSYITRFPPDRIKLDKAFVDKVDQSAPDAAIASAILSLATGLGLKVTAEGIERSGQLEWLRQRGCPEGQGYLLSRPLSPYEFTQRFVKPQQPAIGRVAGI